MFAKATGASNSPITAVGLFIILSLVLFGLMLANLCLGAESLPLTDIYQALINPNMQQSSHQIIWNLRLPRLLLAMMVGCHFAIAGLILQYSLRNPLADPSVLGISSGASLAVLTALFLSSQVLTSPLSLPLFAFGGGAIACTIILVLSARADFHPLVVILYGVALAASFNAVVMWVVVSQGHGETELAVLWLAGSLYGRDFTHIVMLLPWSILGICCLPWLLKPLLLLRNTDEVATACGLALKPWRLISLTVAVALAASAVSVSGPISFVGLIIPHLALFIVGTRQKLLLPVSLFCGAGLMLLADLIGRIAIPPLELPVGAMSAIIGVPVFIYVMQRLGTRT